LGVPAYFHPTTEPTAWAALAATPARFVVLNPSPDGPGKQVDPAYRQLVSSTPPRARLLGYIDTSYGKRDPATLLAQAKAYRDWYGVSGVFLDEVTADEADLPWYTTLVHQLRAAGADAVVLNPGVYPVKGYLPLADAVVVFEGDAAAFDALSPPAWAAEFPPDRYWQIVYGVDAGQLKQVLRRAADDGAATVLVTDRRGTNPYAGLPSYLPAERRLLAAPGCRAPH
jgi:hypothetical protein